MDLSPQQVTEIQEIEKQVNQGQQTGPKILSQTNEKDKSVLVNLLAAVGISVGATAVVILLVVFPFGKKQPIEQPNVTTGTLTIAQPNITVTTEYVNPFSATAQYSNPFTASQNPFANLTQ